MSHDHHESHLGTYFTVFMVLCVCTVISVIADVVHFAPRNVVVVVVMAVAVTKALCVMMYFMHLKFERAWKYLLLAPTMIIAAAIPLSLASDVAMHYYTPENPQVAEYERQQAAAAAHPAGDHAPSAEHH
jgi:cytochrome c oxidase subunit 4